MTLIALQVSNYSMRLILLSNQLYLKRTLRMTVYMASQMSILCVWWTWRNGQRISMVKLNWKPSFPACFGWRRVGLCRKLIVSYSRELGTACQSGQTGRIQHRQKHRKKKESEILRIILSSSLIECRKTRQWPKQRLMLLLMIKRSTCVSQESPPERQSQIAKTSTLITCRTC